jgi:hypothetical protein
MWWGKLLTSWFWKGKREREREGDGEARRQTDRDGEEASSPHLLKVPASPNSTMD